MIHVTLPQLCAYLDGELAEASAELVRRHVSDCLECAERFGRMEELDETLLRILSDEPEEEFFAHLSASIPLGQSAKSARPAPPKSVANAPAPNAKQKAKPVKQVAKPKAKPESKAVVAVVNAPAKAEAKEAPPSKPPASPAPLPAPAPRKRRPEPRPRRREEDYAPVISPRAAAIAVVICCVVAGSIAWVTLRPKVRSQGSVTNATTANDSGPTPEDLLERSAGQATEEPAPTEGTATTDEPSKLEESSTGETTPAAVVSETTGESSPPEPSPLEPSPEAAKPAPTLPPRQTKPKAKASQPVAEKLVEREPRNFVPVRKVITETVVEAQAPTRPKVAAPSEKPARVALAPDAGAAAVRAAKSASLDAAKSKLAMAFDKSADAWEKSLPLLEDAPEDLAAARREWAQARFQAWAAEPTPARRDAAVTSSRQYLLYAPPGPERDQAWTWLGRLKH